MPEKPSEMKAVRRTCFTEDFEVSAHDPIPTVPTAGARVKVLYAGACYTDRQLKNTGRKRPQVAGIYDTSLFPGYEVSGIIDALGSSVEENKYKVGEKVIVFPEEDNLPDQGYAEFIVVKDAQNLVKIPDGLAMEVAAILPTGGLLAFNTIMRLKSFVKDRIESREDKINILVVGAGGLGLWIVRLAKYILCSLCADTSKVKIVVADPNIDKLMIAKDHGCADVIHWNDAIHEEYILDRTLNACYGGVDIIIDYVSSPRTTNRALKVLKDEGILVVGGNSQYDIQFSLATLAEHQQVVMGVSRGSRQQLAELAELMAQGAITPPAYDIFPVDEANKVFEQLSQCKINGRAVLQVGEEETAEEASGLRP